jgi:hypothetical protein
MKHKVFIIIISISIILTSCSSTKNFTEVTYTKIEKNDCKSKSDNVFLFSESDSLNFDYQQVGLIGVTPGDEITQSEIETLIKLEAWKNCANGVIVVPANSAEKATSMEKEKVNKPEKYSKGLNYIAIKIKEDSSFLAKYFGRTDTSFISKGILLQNKLHEPEPTGFEKVIKNLGKLILSFALSSLMMWFTLWVMYNPNI